MAQWREIKYGNTDPRTDEDLVCYRVSISKWWEKNCSVNGLKTTR